MNETLRARLNRFQGIGLLVGILGLVLCAIGAFTHNVNFFSAYLFAYLFWLGLALGCFCVAMIHYLTAGRWGEGTRRVLEAGYMTLPVMAVLFVPIFFGLKRLYPWARPDEVAKTKPLQLLASYENFPWFVARMIIVFAIWIVMAWLLRRWSLAQDETKDPGPLRKMRTLSGPGLVIYGLTTTVAFVDWVMSLEPGWYSTMFPVIIWIGQVLVAYAFATMGLRWFQQHEPISRMSLGAAYYQLGNLLLAFVIFWTYVSFGQLLIIWSGNLPHEIDWYLHHIAGRWKWVVGFLAFFHFFFPFFLLLFRSVKKPGSVMMWLAAILFIAQIVEDFWLVSGSVYTDGVHVSWLDFAALFGVGGIWMAVFLASLKGASLLPQNDPRIKYSFAHAR